MSVTTEVVDDEEQHVVTAGSIITVTIGLERQGLDTFMGRVGLTDEEDNEAEELDEEDKDMVDEEEDEKEEEKEEEKKKGPVWKKPQQKKKAGKKPGKGKQKSKQKLKAVMEFLTDRKDQALNCVDMISKKKNESISKKNCLRQIWSIQAHFILQKCGVLVQLPKDIL